MSLLSPVALRLDAMYHDTAHATTAITPSVRRIAFVIAIILFPEMFAGVVCHAEF